MRIVRWAPITETERIPPLGEVLRHHIQSYQNPTVRRASCSAWNLLYQVLRTHRLAPGIVAFEPGGKPYFQDSPIWFSLSHSKDVCAVSVADTPTGVDVEHERENYPAHLAERSLTAKEKDGYDGNFTRLWCRKESIAKLTGIGISGYPSGLDTTDNRYMFSEARFLYKNTTYCMASVVYAEFCCSGRGLRPL